MASKMKIKAFQSFMYMQTRRVAFFINVECYPHSHYLLSMRKPIETNSISCDRTEYSSDPTTLTPDCRLYE